MSQEEIDELYKKIQEEVRNMSPEERDKSREEAAQKQKEELIKRVAEGKAFFAPKEWSGICVDYGDLMLGD